MNTMNVAIDGMSCGHCVARVRKTLESAPGVQVNDVAIGSASLSYDPAVTTPEKIAGAVSAAGYPARRDGRLVGGMSTTQSAPRSECGRPRPRRARARRASRSESP